MYENGKVKISALFLFSLDHSKQNQLKLTCKEKNTKNIKYIVLLKINQLKLNCK